LVSYLGSDDAREVEEVLPEVEEMTALALGALRVLHGEIEAKEY
jgi:butyrate kinase